MKIREDLVGVTIVRDTSGRDHTLYPGDTIPDGVTVGSHLTGTGVAAKNPKLKVPPKAGPGSSTKAWRDYGMQAATREGLNIDIPEDASKADIIEALDEAKIRTE